MKVEGRKWERRETFWAKQHYGMEGNDGGKKVGKFWRENEITTLLTGFW